MNEASMVFDGSTFEQGEVAVLLVIWTVISVLAILVANKAGRGRGYAEALLESLDREEKKMYTPSWKGTKSQKLSGLIRHSLEGAEKVDEVAKSKKLDPWENVVETQGAVEATKGFYSKQKQKEEPFSDVLREGLESLEVEIRKNIREGRVSQAMPLLKDFSYLSDLLAESRVGGEFTVEELAVLLTED